MAPLAPIAARARYIVVAAGLLALLPWVSAAVALLAGIALALTLGNPFPAATRQLAHKLLAWSVIGLGASMNLAVVGRIGLHGLGYTALGIAVALAAGSWLGRRLGVRRDASLLITVGTAICGGSAIAAIAPTIGARDHDTSIALVTVFLLNAVALLVFPAIGQHLRLSQDAFGLWSALAIHDTSSVIGAASRYGERALEVATAAKLARALWIVPVTFAIAARRARAPRVTTVAPRRPWFIAGFLAAAAVVTFVPGLAPAGHVVTFAAHRLLAVTLFLIGLGLTRPALRTLGIRPLVQAIALWILLAGGTLLAITQGWIA
ncbi:MAG: putative sulfate exporter family transporter [Kofleriaceae bacterium]